MAWIHIAPVPFIKGGLHVGLASISGRFCRSLLMQSAKSVLLEAVPEIALPGLVVQVQRSNLHVEHLPNCDIVGLSVYIVGRPT